MPQNNYILLPRAKQDIREIIRYVSLENAVAAKELKQSFLDAFKLLGERPTIGHTHQEWTNKAVRFWPAHPNYMVVYYPDSSPIEVARIYHTARDFGRIFH